MYPDLSYILHAIIGTEPDNALSIVKTFGLMLIIAFLASAWFLMMEFRRKEKQGLLKSSTTTVTVGKPASAADILWNAVLGFILGFKLYYIATHFPEFQADTAGVLLSAKGSFTPGLLGAALLGFWKYWDARRTQLPRPETKTIEIKPHQRVGDITVVAAISGIAGAKLAAMFESASHFRAFLNDPLGQLFSGSGLAIYGGLILAFIVVLWYVVKKGLAPLHVMDAAAPAMMVGYGVGRIGCQLSGDGDWGIVNTAEAPSWWFLPEWLWAYDYPHNVLNEGVPIEGCTWEYCSRLAEPVFPTPMYETIMAFVIVGILWSLRKRITIPGMLFFIYVVFTAIERFFIEKIRVNPDIHILGMEGSQAEYVSVFLFVIGIGGVIWAWRRTRRVSG